MEERSSLRLDLLHLAAFLAILAAFLVPRYLSQGTLFFAILHDPSGVHLYVPLQVAARELWAEGVPLWNPWAGCGAPHLACLQSSVFYPLNVLFLVLPPIPAAELLVVLRLALCGFSCYVLGRGLRLSRGAALFLAVAYTTNNWELRFANLGNLNSDLLLPVTALVFLRAGETGKRGTALWAVVLTALHVLAGMPESAFFAFGFVALWYLFGAFLGAGRGSARGAVRKLVLLGGIFAGGALLAAVQVLPFLEFLGVSWSTHGGDTDFGMAHAPSRAWPALAYPFQEQTAPLLLTTLTLGAVGFLFALRGLCRPLHGGLNLFLAAVGVLAVMKLFGVPPVQALGRLPVVEMLAFPRYLISPLLLAWMVVAAMGFDEWWAGERVRWGWWPWALGLPVLCVLWLWGCGLSLPRVASYYPWALLGVTLAVAGLGLFRGRVAGARPLWILGVALLLLGGEQWLHFSRIPGDFERFEVFYKRPLAKEGDALGELMGEKIDRSQRLAFTGSSAPFIPQMSGPLRGFGYQDAIFVERYRRYLKAVTGIQDAAGRQVLPIPRDRSSSALLDVAAVRGVVLRGERQASGMGDDRMRALASTGFVNWTGATPPRFMSPTGEAAVHRMEMRAEVPFSGGWRIPRGEYPQLSLRYGLGDGAQGPVQVKVRCGGKNGPRVLLDEVIEPGEPELRRADLAVPELLEGRVRFALTTRNLSTAPASFVLADLRTTSFEEFDERDLIEVGQTGPYTLFENQRALPRAYFASEVWVEEDPDAILAALESPDFVPGRMVVLEEPAPIPLPAEPGASSTVRLVEDGARRVVALVEAESAGILVLSDTYYPGWRALVDGEEREILPANAAFRAVPLERGQHRVEFLYQPTSFLVGAWISVLTLLAVLGVALRRRRGITFPERTND